ncbi:nitroreductase family deazaflavin-dependent oxidoreductase [Gordonia amicalis]|uniref:nitroreductase family deazaflavin-dependent oxidoreductase n=1 Tax=Gordonia amicalis TaxID=89053 RepID=UPI0002A655E2|nr:nitroreductase family deazaflavin-dependent oxidoreductase [Gordonia amicalis]MBA5848131.1 nitroreductase family deazaflavin-dependent oxidoreductase [Gordonia amicalis]MCZ0915171.1 nitroreductase family deazaflavin-dependent oxidoreductase [Gordonia amicalis]MCZ4578459.1 nitroreductase family deazaflavin-dependent oxidoreductase [Gordonia amicalis]MDV7172553.1 nitroreductase family deazaflavin-dependent oxidoreductase [Gordonia amicalis]NKX76141.1 nitroreductase family deazaflavin-dependen
MSVWQWYQRKMNERTVTRIRNKSGTMWGMDMVILRTKGRKSGRPRETPLSWFPYDGDWLVVASGGGKGNPDWYANLAAHPDAVAVERHGAQPVPVTPVVLTGPEREAAWNAVVSAQPRYAKYQKKATREYPVVKLATAGECAG